MKRILLCSALVMLSLITTNVYAYDIAVENANGVTIYYNYINDGQELEVTYGVLSNNNRTDYSGSIVIPEEVTYMNRTRKVTRIGPWTFYYCKGLTSVTIPNSVTSIGNEAFYNCISLTSITIPSSVTSIGEALCYYCTNLTSVSIPNSLTSISKNAFSQCYSLTSVTIPESVKSIGAASFAGCASLTSITIPFGVTSILIETFSGCSGLISVKIPNSVTSIGDYAFRRCTSLNSIIIPNSVTSIGVNAFENCSGLKSITIPNSVTVIKENAFEGCDLDAVISMIEDPFTIRGKDGMYRAFSVETFNNAVLSVPANAIEKYKATEGWQDFANILTLDSIKHPFVEAGKRWCVHGFNMGSAHRVIDYYFTNEEETINGKTYLPMYEKEGEQNTLVGLFREEDHRVYLYNKDAGREFLTYDFSLQEGDEFTPEYGDFSHGKVTKVSYKEVNGEKLKVLTIATSNGTDVVWIEGVGVNVASGSSPLEGMYSIHGTNSWGYYTAYVLYGNSLESNYYLPFSFGLNSNGWWGQQPQTDRVESEDKNSGLGLHYILLPDPEHDCYALHVYGDTIWSNSPNRYVYCVEDKSTHKLKLQFEELEPSVDGTGRYHINLSFPFFLSGKHYVVVDEQGEHPVPVLDDYRPFIEEGKEWEVAHPGILGTDFGNKALMKYCFYFDGDMMVNGRLCKKMMCRKEYSIYASGEPTTTTYVGALYEENRRVYYAPPESYDFVLLYDFGSSVGSEISYYSTETKEMYKGYIKNRKVSNDEKFHGRTTFIPYYVREYDIFLNDDRYDYLWREGVGYKGFINSFDFDQSPYTELMSCTVGDEVLYYDSYFVFYPQSTPDPSEVKKNTIDFTHVVKTRPKAPRRGVVNETGDDEPLTGEYSMKELFVNFKSLSGPYIITICNDSGTEIYRKEVQTSNVVGLNTDISGYEKGEYTITVENDEEAYTAKLSIDEETAIQPLPLTPSPVSEGEAGAMYDLSGRRIANNSSARQLVHSSTLPKGIYIKDGRKVVVK